VFELSSLDNTTWQLLGEPLEGENDRDGFGKSAVALSSDGGRIGTFVFV
jgi:hypothetical protein